MDPLYENGLNRYTHSIWHIRAAYHFSPSSINQILGLFVTVVWFGLIVRTLLTATWSEASHLWAAGLMSGFTLLTCFAFWRWGRTYETDSDLEIYPHQRRCVDRIPD